MNYGGYGFNNFQPYNSNYLSVPSQEDVVRYPVAPGNMITFRLQNEPILIDKSMSLNAFDKPIYKRYRLVEEEMDFSSQTSIVDQSIKSDLAELRKSMELMNERINDLKDHIDGPSEAVETEEIKPEWEDKMADGIIYASQADYKGVSK